MSRIIGVITLILLAALCGCQTAEDKRNQLVRNIDEIGTGGDRASQKLMTAVHDGILADPAECTMLLLPKLNDDKISESQRAIYVWALGIAGDKKSVDPIIKCEENAKSEFLKLNCLRALGTIGGDKSGEFLLSQLEKISDENQRFEILNLLGQMQYEKALPATGEIIRKDSKLYWQSIFIFGKMGDKSIPFLLSKLNDNEVNVRINVINVLGTWLMAPEATLALRDRYRQESDPKLRGMILSALEYVTVNPDEIYLFSLDVLAKEKDPAVRKFAKETIENFPKMQKEIADFKNNKQVSAKKFQQAYEVIYESFGKKGNYNILEKTSNLNDEPRLKKLRERILCRNSDEAFYDYEKINNIIRYNRFVGEIK